MCPNTKKIEVAFAHKQDIIKESVARDMNDRCTTFERTLYFRSLKNFGIFDEFDTFKYKHNKTSFADIYFFRFC